MPRVNVQEETRLFGEKLRNGYFSTERSKNNEVDYAEEKEQRDTLAVKEFTNTAYFSHIRDMR